MCVYVCTRACVCACTCETETEGQREAHSLAIHGAATPSISDSAVYCGAVCWVLQPLTLHAICWLCVQSATSASASADDRVCFRERGLATLSPARRSGCSALVQPATGLRCCQGPFLLDFAR